MQDEDNIESSHIEHSDPIQRVEEKNEITKDLKTVRRNMIKTVKQLYDELGECIKQGHGEAEINTDGVSIKRVVIWPDGVTVESASLEEMMDEERKA